MQRPMQDDNKNFRSHYYERVGFRGVDERKTVDALLSEDPVSRTRCEAFALKCAVPADRRRKLWSSILGRTGYTLLLLLSLFLTCISIKY